MIYENDVLKLRILMFFLAAENGTSSVMELSRSLREEKQKISRILMYMEKEGLVDRQNNRAPALTELGKKTAVQYRERCEAAQNHLLYEGLSVEKVQNDAQLLALYASNELFDTIKASDVNYRLKHELRELQSFDGEEFCKHLSDGDYKFPFIIYREKVKNNSNISMANNGFEHPCVITVKNGVGTVSLQALSITHRSGLNGKIITGKVSKLEYFTFGRFVSAEFGGNVISFPAKSLGFVNIGSGFSRIMHGSVCLNLQCSCGPLHMPESKAIFTLMI